jgi:hypothetical protein
VDAVDSFDQIIFAELPQVIADRPATWWLSRSPLPDAIADRIVVVVDRTGTNLAGVANDRVEILVSKR